MQCSSIMPQKRNPVALEHARALGSKALGQAQAVSIAVHNTPFGDIVDTEDDLQPLVATAFRDAIRAIRLVAAAMSQATFDVEKMAARAAEGGTTVTELADTLARTHALPFRVSHEVAAHFVAERRVRPQRHWSKPRRGDDRGDRPHAAVHGGRTAARAERRALHRGAADPRWARTGPHDGGAARAPPTRSTRIAPGRSAPASGSTRIAHAARRVEAL